MNDLVLTIDCGTQGIRGIIFDPNGCELAKVEKIFEGYYSLEPGYMEAPPSMFWKDFQNVTQTLKKEYPHYYGRLVGMNIAVQRDIATIADEEGEGLRDFISWMDRRTLEKPLKIPQPFRFAFNVAGKKEFTESFNKGTHAHWIKVHEHELWQNAHYYIFLSTYLMAKLVGKVIDSKSNIAGHFPFDYKNKKWCGPYEIKRQIIQIEREKLCDLVDSCEIMGRLSEEAAEATGLPVGLPVVGSGTDKGCETIGVGCVDSKTASVSLGTQSTVETTSNRYYELVPFYPPFPSVDPKGYNPEITIYDGFWMINWFIETFAEKEKDLCAKKGIDLFDFLNEQLDRVPVGSEGLVLQPFWGQESFRPEAKGSIIGFTEKQTKYHIYRSIIEGLAFGLLEGLELIEKKSHVVVTTIGLSGGGSRSDQIAQIMADVFGREVYRVQTYETTGLGGAMATYVGLGIYRNLGEAKDKMVRKSKVFVPSVRNHQIYDHLYHQVYKKAYARYKPLYKKLKAMHFN